VDFVQLVIPEDSEGGGFVHREVRLHLFLRSVF